MITPIAWIVFDHAERRNAISVDMWRQIPAAVRDLAVDDEVRVVIMRGQGEKAFIAGADISEFARERTACQARSRCPIRSSKACWSGPRSTPGFWDRSTIHGKSPAIRKSPTFASTA